VFCIILNRYSEYTKNMWYRERDCERIVLNNSRKKSRFPFKEDLWSIIISWEDFTGFEIWNFALFTFVSVVCCVGGCVEYPRK